MLLDHHEDRNMYICGAKRITDIGSEALASLRPGHNTHLLADDGTKLALKTVNQESASRHGSYNQYSLWLDRLILHLSGRPERYTNKMTRLRTAQYIKHHFINIMLLPGASYSSALAFIYAAQQFFSTYRFGSNELDRHIMEGGLENLEYTYIYPALDAKARALQPLLAAQLANPEPGPAPAPHLPPGRDPPRPGPRNGQVYCQYCGSREHDMAGHPRDAPVTKPCPECQHAHARIGPLKSNCTLCRCKCFTDAEEEEKKRKRQEREQRYGRR